MEEPEPGPAERAFSVFDELVELDDTGRAARLRALADEDPNLAREVEALVAAYLAAGEFLDRPALEAAPTLADAALGPHGAASATGATELEPGALLGSWRVVSRLGAGGMGEVWEVERSDPQLRQRAALKLLKRGLDSEDVLRRFRVERQLLARLRHPAIAHLYDGGLAPDGRPFYVMELVEGEPITDACARRGLPLDERLRVFLTVCDAVETAHRSLVVHRDLKPANVLMTAGGEVKLLDFGIAKVLAEDAGDGAATRDWERLLTPAYAAPEQILGAPVTTATDVYSLGVVLYELLVGRLPHLRLPAVARLADEVARETVERPSSAVRRATSNASESEPLAAEEREHRARRLRGDLDWIVLRALAAEPERRYPSAAALAADLRRHLASQPVEARPDSFGYRAGRFVRRHRVGVAAAALVALSLLGGLAAALVQAERARREAARAERVRDFLVSIFESIDPERVRGASVTAREVVAEGARRFGRELAGDPEAQAELHGVLARAERSLGQYDSALVRAREARRRNAALHGAADPRVGEAAATVVGVLVDQGKLEAAEREARAALARLDAEGAEGQLAAARLETALGYTLHQQWRLEDAEPVLRRAVARREERLGRRHPDTVAALLSLAAVLGDAERFEEAERLHHDVLALARAVHGPDHPAVAAAEASLGAMLDTLKRFEEAERRYLDALAIRRRAHGTEEHVAIAGLHQMLGILYRRTGRLDLAEREAAAALDLYRRIDPGHYEVANSLGTLGMVAWARGDYRRAHERMSDALAATIEAEGEESFAAHVRRGNLAAVEGELGDFAAAERLTSRALAGYEALGESRSSYVANTLVVHGAIARGAGRVDEALERHRLSRAIRVELYGEGHVEVDGADLEIALDLLERGRAEDRVAARRALEPALARCRQAAATTDRCEAVALADARLLARERGPAVAVPALRAAAERIARSRGAEHPLAAEARAYLAQALIAGGSPELASEGREQLADSLRVLASSRGAAHPLVTRLGGAPGAR